MRLLPLFLICLSSAVFAADSRATIIMRDGTRIEAAEVAESETEVVYQLAGATTALKRPMAQVDKIQYAGLNEGEYATAMAALQEGRTADAIEALRTVAQGDQPWQQLYGNQALGDALERSGDAAGAADAFRAALDQAMRPRLAMDLRYRLGLALAQAQDPGATAVADELQALVKGKAGAPYEHRANAIRAAIAASDATSLEPTARKVGLKFADDGEIYLHYQHWLTRTWLSLERPRDAIRAVDEVLKVLPKNHPARSSFMLVRALALVGIDGNQAMIELVRFDLGANGSEAERCQARLAAAKLMAKDAETAAKDPQRSGWAEDQRNSAAILIDAAANSTAAIPEKEAATTLLHDAPQSGR